LRQLPEDWDGCGQDNTADVRYTLFDVRNKLAFALIAATPNLGTIVRPGWLFCKEELAHAAYVEPFAHRISGSSTIEQ